MLKEIVLPIGTAKVTVGDIPKLVANAIYPIVPKDWPRRVTKLKKLPVTESARNEWCGLGVQAFPVSLTNDDLAGLAHGCWKHLPNLSLPIDEPIFQRYLDAFQNDPPKDWILVPETESPYIFQMVYWHNTVKEWQKVIEQAVTKGQLVPRSKDTLLPRPDAIGEVLRDCFITVADLTTFVARFDVGVRFADCNEERIDCDALEFTTSARPLHVDPALVALDADVIVEYHNNIGSGRGTGHCSAGQYRAEIETRIKRQAEGFFTLDEAAQVLADSRTGIDAQEMISQMRSAFESRNLNIRNHSDRLPVLNEKDIRNFRSLVTESDINEWLHVVGAGYQFPQATSANSEAHKKTTTEHRKNYDISHERGCRRQILEHWAEIELLHGPNADGIQVERFLKHKIDQSDSMPALKTIRNKLILLRKEKLIP